jgi:hypothetical protein
MAKMHSHFDLTLFKSSSQIYQQYECDRFAVAMTPKFSTGKH